jgi:glucose-6-phosphate 1-dehydrogenase
MTPSTSIVIFGASGDLTRRKLVPAFFHLFLKGRLPETFRIVGFSGTPYTHTAYRAHLLKGVEIFATFSFKKGEWQRFAACIFYISGNSRQPQDIEHLAAELLRLEGGPANRLFYLATPPQVFGPIVSALDRSDLLRQSGSQPYRRVIIEKPFGVSMSDARQLDQTLHNALGEDQIYRIDHYLGKETVQNILVFRFGNTIFEPLWNHNYIESVQITVAEMEGVGSRAGYYDPVGVLPDMFQNHLLSLFALVAMEPPASFQAAALHNEKIKVLSSVRAMDAKGIARHTVRGQYRGYLEEPKVPPGSQTATFAALRLQVDNWRWQGVPFFLRSGKRLAEKSSHIVIQFKCPPHLMFPLPPDQPFTSNALVLCLQPDEGIHLRFEAKVPDTAAGMRTVDMGFHYSASFGSMAIPEAYERLLLDALTGDQSLYTRSDSTEATWQIIEPIQNVWRSAGAPPLVVYEPGSWGPLEAQTLPQRDGLEWLGGCNH